MTANEWQYATVHSAMDYATRAAYVTYLGVVRRRRGVVVVQVPKGGQGPS